MGWAAKASIHNEIYSRGGGGCAADIMYCEFPFGDLYRPFNSKTCVAGTRGILQHNTVQQLDGGYYAKMTSASRDATLQRKR